MVIQPKVRLIIRKIANETGLSFNQIRDIAMAAQFRFLINYISEGEAGNADTFKNVLLPHLGTFKANPGKIYYSTKKRREKELEMEKRKSD